MNKLEEIKKLEDVTVDLWGRINAIREYLEKKKTLDTLLGSGIVSKEDNKTVKAFERKFERRLKLARNQIEEIQESCEHGKWIYLGHDSHYDHAKCGICGYVDYKA